MTALDWPTWYEGRRVLILGGSGFLGRHVSRELARHRALLTVASTTVHSFPFLLPPSERVTRAICDVRDAASVAETVNVHEVVFNLAGHSGTVSSTNQPAADAAVNILGALSVLEAVRLYAPGAKVVFPGSRLEYGTVGILPVSEDAPLRPTSPYGVHKLAAEHHHRNYWHIHGVRTTVLRITIPFGAHASPVGRDFGIANRFIQLAVEDQALRIFGDGRQLRDYVYVDDVVSALALAGATRDSDGEVYNVGAGRGIALVDFARLAIAEAGGGRLEFAPWPELALAVETGDFVANISAIREALRWQPLVGLEEGVRRAVHSLRRVKDHL